MPRRRRTPVPEPPAELSAPQRGLWLQLAAEHAGNASTGDVLELRSLVDTNARLDAVRAQLDQDGFSAVCSTGQIRAHPLLAEESRLRAELGERLTAWGHVCYVAANSGY